MKCLGCRSVGRAGRFWALGMKPYLYIHRLTDEYTTMLTNEYIAIRSSVTGIFLGFGTKEYKKTKEDTLFFCSGGECP
jgi:hypothetical protein